MICKATVEKDKKNQNSVVGRVFTGNHAGKIVFFESDIRPKVGEIVVLEDFEDRGRYLIAGKWVAETQKQRDQKLVQAMELRVARSQGDSFKEFTRALVDHSGGKAEYATGAYIEIPLRALEEGVKGDSVLMGMAESFRKNVSENRDIISETTVRLMDEAKKIFEGSGNATHIMELKVFDELIGLMDQLIKHHGQWPQRVIVGPLGANGRYVLPLE